MDLDNSLWQRLIDRVHDRWADGVTYDEIIASCDRDERVAMLLGKLNYQVENGGFAQWVDNGYGLKAHETIEALKLVGGYRSLKITEMIKSLIPHIDFSAKKGSNCWLASGDEDEDDELGHPTDDLDNEFYLWNNEWCEQVEAWLVANHQHCEIRTHSPECSCGGVEK